MEPNVHTKTRKEPPLSSSVCRLISLTASPQDGPRDGQKNPKMHCLSTGGAPKYLGTHAVTACLGCILGRHDISTASSTIGRGLPARVEVTGTAVVICVIA